MEVNENETNKSEDIQARWAAGVRCRVGLWRSREVGEGGRARGGTAAAGGHLPRHLGHPAYLRRDGRGGDVWQRLRAGAGAGEGHRACYLAGGTRTPAHGSAVSEHSSRSPSSA